LCLIFGTALVNSPILLTIAVTLLTLKTIFFVPTWRDQEAVWQNDVDTFPENAHAYNNMAQHIMNQARVKGKTPTWKMNKAAFYMTKAVMMVPDSWEIQMNMACLTVMHGDLASGLKYTREAIKLLRPIMGGSGTVPMEKLMEQEKMLSIKIKEQEKRLGESLSPSTAQPKNGGPKNGGRDNGKTKSKVKTKRISQPV